MKTLRSVIFAEVYIPPSVWIYTGTGTYFSLSRRLSTKTPVRTEISFSQDFPPNNTATLSIKKHLRKKEFFRFGVLGFSKVF